jgi:hypothetical protein
MAFGKIKSQSSNSYGTAMDSKLPKTILKKKTKVRGLTPLNFKTYSTKLQ